MTSTPAVKWQVTPGKSWVRMTEAMTRVADRGVVALERARQRDREALAGYREHLVCDRGDFEEYWRLRDRSARLERSLSRWQQTEGREQHDSFQHVRSLVV